MPRIVLLPLAMLTLALPGVSLARITQRGTPAGKGAARAVLLRRSGLGGGWSEASGAPAKAPSLTCSAYHPSATAVEVGRAESPTWGQSSSGPFLSETAYAYASAVQEASVWKAIARPQFVRCLAQALTAGSGGGVRFRVTRRQVLGLTGAPGARRYRVSGTATGSGQSIDVYLDVILLGRGQAIAAVNFSSFDSPVGTKLELRLVRAALRRLG